jgi:hypothetical protein
LPRNQKCGRPSRCCRQLGRRSGSIATCRLPHVAGAGPASPAHGLRRKEKSAMHFRLPCILGDYNFDGVSHSLFRKGKSNFASPKCSFLLESGTRKCSNMLHVKVPNSNKSKKKVSNSKQRNVISNYIQGSRNLYSGTFQRCPSIMDGFLECCSNLQLREPVVPLV